MAKNKAQQLNAYLNLYLREEIQQEGLTRNISHFSRFLESISFSQGSLLNISNVAQDCGVERKVVESYIGILEDLLLSTRVRVFSKKAKQICVYRGKEKIFNGKVLLVPVEEFLLNIDEYLSV